MGRNSDDKTSRGHSRRALFKLAGAATTVVTAGFAQGQGAPTSAPHREALETLTAAEADILEAFCARLIPSDANGPGAREARAAHYIDRALGGALASARLTCVVHPSASTGAISYSPRPVPELTMSRPARSATGPPPSYQVGNAPGMPPPLPVPRYTMEPVRTPITSPSSA